MFEIRIYTLNQYKSIDSLVSHTVYKDAMYKSYDYVFKELQEFEQNYDKNSYLYHFEPIVSTENIFDLVYYLNTKNMELVTIHKLDDVRL